MRKFFIPLLAASALMPAAASADDGGFVRGIRAHGERAAQRDSSSNDQPQRVQRSDRSSSGEEPRARIERADRPARVERNFESSKTADPELRRVPRTEQVQATEPVQQNRRTEHVEGDGMVGAIQRIGRDAQARQQDEVQVHRDREGSHSRPGSHGDYHDDLRQEHGDLHASDPTRREHREWHRDAERQHDRRHAAWNTSWRRDSRYDWYNYRTRYGSLYRLGRYYDPYGWGYRRWSIGFNLWPSYYGSNYWLNDPSMYRLPPAYGPYRWVRYWDDALLVNIYTGQVVDVIHSFFW